MGLKFIDLVQAKQGMAMLRDNFSMTIVNRFTQDAIKQP